ncbi:hypothetical protein [Dysgonomonas sp. 520]|uniref:hypothetical protein n=1 Tax=Dysgonomonas sp. 520 TaxID=2302931 RepID=UPI0013D0946F|nr:hypothetical protein [Dysgonomonas sp. 520]NDW09030.1 hypothetical protein [Dysgonomonas sp. 520]
MKTAVTILLFLIPFPVFAQYVGLGYQVADLEKHQFVATLTLPWLMPRNNFNPSIATGIEYSTGAAKISGLNIKALSASLPFLIRKNNNWLNIDPGVDAGYMFGLGHSKNGVVVSPNLHLSFNLAFHLKAGYDYNITEKNGQFFIRLAFGLGSGLLIHLNTPPPYRRHLLEENNTTTSQ